MKKGTAFALIAIALGVGYGIKSLTVKSGDGGGNPSAARAPSPGAPSGPSDGTNRVRVTLEGPSKGPADALVNIVEFSDFECPFCSRVNPTMDRLQKEYPGKIRVFFRHNPLPFHPNATPAAEASLAAHAQGKFWEMHDKLFANQKALDRASLEKYAQEIGLDVGKFKSALDSHEFKKQVDADMEAGRKLGVQGTPNLFVNGRIVEGAVPYEQFKTIVDDELARAQKLIASGTPAGQVYSKLMAGAREPGTAAPTAPNAPPARPGNAASAEVYNIPVGDAPVKGGKQPKVTLIEFSEFQCPFCAKVGPTLAELHKTYGDDIAIAWKHLPLPFHNNAKPAAIAAEAAREQGKFWEMHDKLFANQQALDAASLEKYAQEIGLNVSKWKAALGDAKLAARVDADAKLADQFGARGTPTFFINGRLFRGAQPLDAFKTVIEEEIKKADAKLASGTSRRDLYAALTKEGKAKFEQPAPTPGAGEPTGTMKVEIGENAAVKGPKDALVTIVQFSDFQCPFCSRVEPTINQVMDTYKGKVRVVWKDLPLPFHQNATPAAIAARAAQEQGKFWEMHEKLFKNQQALDSASLEKYAQEIGLNMGKFKAAIASDKLKKQVEADAAQAAKVGARGTPAFFINGTFLSGAQPFDAFKAKIDVELKKAEELVKNGTPKAKVYDAIMKDAKDAPAAAPAAAAAEAGPESDQKVYKVDAGKSPARGPKNAPITAVLFSDFQCPFCKRVEPTLEQLEKQYPGKIRVVWKNFPLDFHQNAKPAAMAAYAANEQGKFWDMHKKLFDNQTALDRASLDKYAQEIGLDMKKYKEAMDSNKYGAVIDAEMKEGQAVGVNGTPATFINGRKIGGAYPFETFKKIVDQELSKGGGVAKKGT